MITYGIGEAARLCGVSADTLRYYERAGLIEPAERTASGYRRFTTETITRVRQIRKALLLGFRLRELAEIFTVRKRGGAPCRNAIAILEKRLGETEMRLEQLAATRRLMSETLEDWRAMLTLTGGGHPARLIDRL